MDDNRTDRQLLKDIKKELAKFKYALELDCVEEYTLKEAYEKNMTISRAHVRSVFRATVRSVDKTTQVSFPNNKPLIRLRWYARTGR